MNTSLAPTKHQFEILDGLRGVAAFAVVIFHFMEFIEPDYNKNFIAHAYLAVDFFFCLSGFVIAYAYDHKLQTIGLWNFFKRRLIRLHPLVIIGAVIGFLAFIFDPYSDLLAKYGWVKTIIMLVTGCLLVPYPIVKERYFNLFHLNPPTWSLMWEYVANILYAVLFVRLKKTPLWVLTVLAAGVLVYEASHATNLGVGWSGDNWAGGGFRVLYSFLAGILVYRMNWRITSRMGFIPTSLLLLIGFLVPFADKANFITDPVLVILYFPFIITLGAGTTVGARAKKICLFQEPSLTRFIWCTTPFYGSL